MDSSALRHEYSILCQLKRVNQVAKAVDLLTDEGSETLVLEDDEAISLDRYLTDKNEEEVVAATERKQIELDRFFALAIQLSEALNELHKHEIVHCDLNPTNILVVAHTCRLLLIDFGSFIPSFLSFSLPLYCNQLTLLN
jgi:serine/threonine protein kinase